MSELIYVQRPPESVKDLKRQLEAEKKQVEKMKEYSRQDKILIESLQQGKNRWKQKYTQLLKEKA